MAADGLHEWLEQKRRRSEANRWWTALGNCTDCGHPWSEHAGTNNDLDGMCGECAYEFEHGERTTEAAGAKCHARGDLDRGTATGGS